MLFLAAISHRSNGASMSIRTSTSSSSICIGTHTSICTYTRIMIANTITCSGSSNLDRLVRLGLAGVGRVVLGWAAMAVLGSVGLV